VDQTLLDPPRRARMEAERARLAEAQARIEVAVYGLRREVDESFFSAALLQEREAQIAGSIAALEARGGQAQARVEQGAALPSEAAAVEAVLLQRREDREEVGANRHAALQRLGRLIGRELDPEKTALEAPALDALFDRARAESLTGRDRPEFSHFAALRRGAQAERDLAATARLPRLTAYARAGYGIPGFDFLRNDLHAYGLAGVRLQWKPFDWGSAGREEQIALLRQRALEAEEAALEAAIDRAIQEDLAAADHLRQTAAADHRIVALRELIERETLARLDEGVVNAAEYLDKETELLEARLRLATHRLELARAQARVLNTLGVEIP